MCKGTSSSPDKVELKDTFFFCTKNVISMHETGVSKSSQKMHIYEKTMLDFWVQIFAQSYLIAFFMNF